MTTRAFVLERDREIRGSNEPVGELANRYGLSPSHVARIRKQPEKARSLSRREEFEAVVAGAWRADCMDDAEWAEWLAKNPLMPDAEMAARPCDDCPLGFAVEMREIGMCNGTPAGVDDEEVDAMVEQQRDTGSGPRIIPGGQEVRVTLEAPCARCLHEPVCAIKRQIDAVESLPVTLPRFDRALTVVLGGTVDCGHFAPAKVVRQRKPLTPEAAERARENAVKAREALAARRAAEQEAKAS